MNPLDKLDKAKENFDKLQEELWQKSLEESVSFEIETEPELNPIPHDEIFEIFDSLFRAIYEIEIQNHSSEEAIKITEDKIKELLNLKKWELSN